MHQHHIMCFSSSLICLLVVTCHGSIVNKYQNEIGYPDNEGEHKLPDDTHISDTIIVVHHKQSVSDLPVAQNSHPTHLSDDQNLHLNQKETSQNKSHIERLPRSAKEDFSYPFPKQNSHSDQVESQQSSTLKRRSKPHHNHNGHNHSHDPHNESDHDPLNKEKNHHEYGHNEDLHDEDYYDSFPNVDDPSHIPKSKGLPEKEKHPKIIDPCKNKHFRDDHSESDHVHEGDKGEGSPSNYHQHPPSKSQEIPGRVWLYASLAVVIISLCGLFSVAVIPIMQKWFYHTLLQFLVGLAVGSLSGDGLLHLMPHAILDGEIKHDHSNGESHDYEDMVSLKVMEVKAVWRGLAALTGIFLFFIAERVLGAVTACRRQKQESKLSRHPKNKLPTSREDGANNGSVGEKLAQPKKNSYDHIREKDEKETIQMLPTEASPSKKGSNQSIHEIGFHGRSSFTMEPEASVAYRPDSESSVIVSEHRGHVHAHSHEIPQSVTAVAWMVILGDGLHNFCDGLAIGAAFASSDADGISTTVAVFCHELPHELGDFAMLLKTGMKVKQALFYNGLSSILCFIGMIIGVALGNVHSATNWVFAGTAGMFLYIALVDMLPELTSPINSSGSGGITTLIVQVLGIFIGVSIMLLIALYEHELHSIVS